MVKNKQSNLIASVKMLNTGCHQQIYYKLRNRGGYSVLVNYQSLLSNLFSLAPPPPNHFPLQTVHEIDYSV